MFSHCIQRFLIRHDKPIRNGYSTLQLLRFSMVILFNDYQMFTHSQIHIFQDEKLLNVTVQRFSGFKLIMWLLVFNESEISIEY